MSKRKKKKKKRLTTSTAGENVDQTQPPYIIGENRKWYNHVAKMSGSKYKIKHIPSLWSRIYSREMKTYARTHTKIYKNVYSNFFIIAQN